MKPLTNAPAKFQYPPLSHTPLPPPLSVCPLALQNLWCASFVLHGRKGAGGSRLKRTQGVALK